jgi:hypothetical protein
MKILHLLPEFHGFKARARAFLRRLHYQVMR